MSNTKVIVGLGSCGIAAGAQEVYNRFQEVLPADIGEVSVTSCVGMCFAEPIVEIEQNGKRTRYGGVDVSFPETVVEALKNGTLPEDFKIDGTEESGQY